MRGRQDPHVRMLAFVDLEARVLPDHPLHTVKALADQALVVLSCELDRMYADVGRPSIPPERLLKVSLLIALYLVHSERAFCEELEYNLLFRWFLDMKFKEPSFDPTVFTKNRQRLLEHRVGQQLLDEVVGETQERNLLSDEHFTVDDTLIEAAASLKSFKRRDGDPSVTTDDDPGNPLVDFHGERRGNATYQSATDPEGRMFRKGKGKEARLVFLADFQVTFAMGIAEREVVAVLVDQARKRRDTPHAAQNSKGLRSAIDGRTTWHPGYAVSQRVRKRVEEIFGWMKTVGGFRRTRYLGLDRTGLAGYLMATAYNLVRMAKLLVPA